MSKLKPYVGLDVSLKETSVAVIDDNDRLVWRGSVASTPEAIADALRKHAARAERIGLEAGQLASWLYHGIKAKGWPVTCIDARHAKAALSLKVNKTDANDAWDSLRSCGSAGFERLLSKVMTARRSGRCLSRAPRSCRRSRR